MTHREPTSVECVLHVRCSSVSQHVAHHTRYLHSDAGRVDTCSGLLVMALVLRNARTLTDPVHITCSSLTSHERQCTETPDTPRARIVRRMHVADRLVWELLIKLAPSTRTRGALIGAC